MEQLNIYKDDRYLISLSRDHWKGLVVQVCRYGPRSAVGEGGRLVEERAPYVAWSGSVSTTEVPNVLTPASAAKFKLAVSSLIAEAKIQMGKLVELDSMMDGVFADHKHRCLKYNDNLNQDTEDVAMAKAIAKGHEQVR